MRVLLSIQYDGSGYSGWQAQDNGKTIQAEIEKALGLICRTDVRVTGAGRTDAGVHAGDQKAHCDIPDGFPPDRLLAGLNGVLPKEIRVRAAEEKDRDFHARHHATGKTYCYRIWNDPIEDVFLSRTHTHIPWPLDVERMRTALRAVVGEHDFRAFTVASPEVATTRREIFEARIETTGTSMRINLHGSGFLRFMVRRIVGSLIEIGLGRMDEAKMQASLEPTFEQARWTAAANGLTLERVHYD